METGFSIPIAWGCFEHSCFLHRIRHSLLCYIVGSHARWQSKIRKRNSVLCNRVMEGWAALDTDWKACIEWWVGGEWQINKATSPLQPTANQVAWVSYLIFFLEWRSGQQQPISSSSTTGRRRKKVVIASHCHLLIHAQLKMPESQHFSSLSFDLWVATYQGNQKQVIPP